LFILVSFLLGFFATTWVAGAEKSLFVADLEVGIPGLVCPSCGIGIKINLRKNSDIVDVKFDVSKQIALIQCARGREDSVYYPKDKEVIKLVKKAGYEVKYIKRLWSKKPNRYNEP
jgi:hypothetical protein